MVPSACTCWHGVAFTFAFPDWSTFDFLRGLSPARLCCRGFRDWLRRKFMSHDSDEAKPQISSSSSPQSGSVSLGRGKALAIPGRRRGHPPDLGQCALSSTQQGACLSNGANIVSSLGRLCPQGFAMQLGLGKGLRCQTVESLPQRGLIFAVDFNVVRRCCTSSRCEEFFPV